MTEIWVCKDQGGTRLTDRKPIWDEKFQCWRSDSYQTWLRIPAKFAGLKRGQCARITGIMIDYRTFEESK